MNLYSPVISGSLTVTGSTSFIGNVTMTGTVSATASNATLLDGTGSVGFTTTASFLAVSSSQQQISSSQQQISSSLLAISRSFASTGSNTFTGLQNFSNTCNPNGFTSGASIYTAGGLQVTYDSYFSSSIFVNGNLTVYGTQSVVHVSSSQFNVGTNIITVNTATPSIRYGGLSVYDSGSTGLSGSILWDSELNRWIYANASGSGGGATYGGGMFISGPRNSQGLGCEQGTTSCMLLVGQGGDHLTSSQVYHDSTRTCFYGNALFVSSSGNVGIGTNPSADFNLHLCGPTSTRIKLEASATTAAALDFYSANTAKWSIVVDNTQTYGKIENRDLATDTIRFYNGSNNLILAPSCGSVGIRTTTLNNTYGTLTVAGTGISIADDGNAKLQIGRYNASVCNAYIKMGTNACSLRFTNAADTADILVMEKGGITCLSNTICAPQFTGGVVCAVGGLNARGATTTWSTFNFFADNPGGSGDQCKTVLAASIVGCTGWGPQLRFSGGTGGFIDIGQDCNGGFVIEASDTPRLNVSQNGFIGISNTAPKGFLHIIGANCGSDIACGLGNPDSRGIINVQAATGVVVNASLTAENIYGIGQFMQWDTNGMRIGHRVLKGGGSGDIHITAGQDSVKLLVYCSGNIGAPNGSNIYNASDCRLKKNIRNISYGICDIMKLRPKVFNWKDNFTPSENGKEMLGFIAQDVQPIVPEVVEQFSDGSDITFDCQTISNPLRVNEKFIIPILTKAMQEQQCMIDTLKSCLGIA